MDFQPLHSAGMCPKSVVSESCGGSEETAANFEITLKLDVPTSSDVHTNVGKAIVNLLNEVGVWVTSDLRTVVWVRTVMHLVSSNPEG